MTRHLAMLAALLLLLAQRTAAVAGPWAQEVAPAPVISAKVAWKADQPHVIALTEATGDPVLHVFRDDGTRVAWASGPHATVALTVEQTGTYAMVVHAGQSAGSATLTVDGVAMCRACPFDAVWAEVPAAPAWTDYRYETVRMAGGTDDTLLLGFGEQRDPAGPVAWDDDGGRGRMATLRGSAVHWLLVAVPPGTKPGPTLLYTNDHRDDADGDGLGAQLERYGTGTCDVRTMHYGSHGVPCLQLDPLDSDGDGVPDGEEVLGYAPRGTLDPALHNLSAVARAVASVD